MNSLLLPYVIALALGMEPQPRAPDAAELAPPATTETADTEAMAVPAGPDLGEFAGREPEEQIATGQWTAAIEIKQILTMTKANWVGVRLYEGQDLLYFSHLLAFRCGLWGIRWGVNGEPATNTVEMEPCHLNTATPNALTDPLTYSIYATLPPESVQSVYVEIIYDDGTTDFAQYQRNEILIP